MAAASGGFDLGAVRAAGGELVSAAAIIGLRRAGGELDAVLSGGAS